MEASARSLRSDSGRRAADLGAVRGRGFLGRLDSALIDEVIDAAPTVYYPKGSISFPGETGVRSAVVVSGLLRYFLSTSAGRQITIRYIGPGDLVGSLALISPASMTGLQAVEPSVLLHLDAARLETIARRRPDLAWAL